VNTNRPRSHAIRWWLLFVTLAALPVRAQSLTRGAYLQVGTPTSVIVRWRTDAATDSRVRFGTSSASLTSFRDVATVTTEHQVRLDGLTPGTRYYYSVGSTTQVLGGGDAGHFFREQLGIAARHQNAGPGVLPLGPPDQLP